MQEQPDSDSNNGQNDPNFSGPSFAQALQQLNLPPLQHQATYAPLLPSNSAPTASTSSSPSASLTASLSPSSSSSSSVSIPPSAPQAQHIATGPPPQPHGPLPIRRPLPMQAHHYYQNVAARLQQTIIRDWIPRVMSPEEISEYRLATHRRMERIRVLEAEQEHTRLTPDARIEQALFMARLDYRIRFFRIFRVNDLPSEILTNIFRFVCWSAPDPRINIKWRLWLTSTSRHWRTVAIEDQTLWNAIWLMDTPRFERSLTWLDRAGNTAIDIRINETEHQPWSLAMTRYIVDKIFTKLSNIRVMIVVLKEWDALLYILHSLRRVAEENLPMVMERLELHRAGPAFVQMGRGFEPSFYLTPIPLFGGAVVPSFRYLSINDVAQRLTTFDIRRIPLERVPNIHQFRTILRDCPSLRKLIMDGAGPGWPKERRTLSSAPVVLPELKTLAIGDFSLEYGTFALSQFSCPSVVDLTLMNLVDQDYTALYQCMTKKMPAVRTLTIYGASLFVPTTQSRNAVVKWLQSMPHLTFLRIQAVEEAILQLFLYDHERMQSTMGPRSATNGNPFRKVYIGAETMHKAKQPHVNKLVEVMQGVGSFKF
ncbi:hypothetical protein BDZ97DRAFT_1751547 [Flammula alnicola]|nr:hypothetical protein BDZ97DRAFT_1751547 [Flammula alnicola]